MSVILCTAGYDHTIRFWEALSGICSRTIPSPDSQVNRLCISPDKRFLAAAGHLNVKLFDIKSSNPNPVLTFQGHTTNITAVAFHCEGKWMVTSSEDGTVKIWDVRTGTIQRDYKHGSPVNDVVIHPNQGELISCDRIGAIRVWDLSENKCTHQLIPEDDVAMASVTVASDGSMLCSGNIRGYVFVWKMTQVRDPITHTDTTSLIPICKYQAHGNYITRVLLSPDVQHLATCSADHTVRIWEVRHDDIDALQAAMAARASTTKTGQANGAGKDGKDGKTTVTNRFKAAGAPSLTSSSMAPTSASNGALNTSTTTGTGTTGPSTSAAATSPASSASSIHSTASDSAEADGLAFELEMTLEGHQRWVWDCAFSADSAYLVTACSDHYARLWELNSQSIIRQYNGHHRGAVCVALNDTALG